MGKRVMFLAAAALLPLLLAGAAAAGEEAAGPDVGDAKAFFARFARLEKTGDPALAELYDDSAAISYQVKDERGRAQSIALTGRQYKEVLRAGKDKPRRMSLNIYSELEYKAEGGRLRISGLRSNSREGTEGTFSLLLVRGADGAWRIAEEKVRVEKAGR